MTIVLKRAGNPVAGIRVKFRHPRQRSFLLRSIERAALSEARSMGIIADLDHPAIFLLQVTMPCGHEVLFKRARDIPLRTTPCPCGDPAHFLVYYECVGMASEPSVESNVTVST
jgi:hypothetical protein